MNENPSSVLRHRGRNARTGITHPLLPRLIALLLGLVLALGIGLQPLETRADLLGNFKRSIGNATSKVREATRRTVDRTRETVRRKVDSARERGRETVNRARERVERRAREQAERTRRAMREKARQAREQTERAQRAAREQARRARDAAERRQRQLSRRVEEQRRRTQDSARALSERARQSTTQALRRARDHGLDLTDSVRDATRRYGSAAGRRLEQAYREADDSFLKSLRTVRERAGIAGQRLVEQTTATHGTRTGLHLARVLGAAANSQEAQRITERSRVLIDGFKDRIRDPQVRERAIAAAITVAALGTYAALHGDDIVQAASYQTLSYGLEHIEIRVDGRSRSLEDVYTEAVLARAPFLAGTTMAEDPAALVVFGTEVVKDDLINRVAIVPAGNGGARTIADTVGYSDDADDVISALQLSSSIEGMAVSAAEQGHLGRHGEAFASVYGNTDRTVRQYRTYGE